MKNKKTTKITKTNTAETINVSTDTVPLSHSTTSLSLAYKIILVAILGVLSYKLATKYRNLVVVGSVNNTPITRFELNKLLVDRYGKQVLDEIVSEKLLASEIKKQNIVITDEQVNAEVEKIKKDYGSEENLKSALESYGLTLDKAKESIKKNLAFKTLVEKSSTIEVKDEAVAKYFNDNKSMYPGKKLDEVKGQIKDMLYQQELYQKSQDLFTKLKQEAKITTFI